MVAVAVTFDGTRLDGSEANTDWANFPSGGQAPSAEANNKYQGTNVVNQKLSTTSLDGLAYISPATVDMTATNRKLWYAKIYVTDFGALDSIYGTSASIGESQSSRYNYNVGGSGAKISRFTSYPPAGGYLIAPINPTVTGWREGTTGGITGVTAIDFYGAQADWLASANAKSENFCLDAIDVGNGLTLLNGTGADTPGTFPDFVAEDQNQPDLGRWGVCFGAGTFVQAQGMLNIGATATATEFDDSTSQVLFLDSYVGTGDFGCTIDIGNASSIINIACTITGLGDNYTEADTRPDHIVTGTSGSYTLTGTLANHRNITFTSVCNINGASLECSLLTQSGSHIQNSTIVTTADSSVACLQDPTFGTSTGIHDTTFVFGGTGTGHAIQISSPGTYDFENLFFQNYGADNTAEAAIDVTTTGAVTININGGDVPSFITAGTDNVDIVSGAVTVKARALQTNGNPIEGARVYLRASDGTGPFPYLESVTITRTGTTATVSHTAHGMETNDKVTLAGITDKSEDNGIHTIVVTDANTYTYTTTDSGSTSYTGTITSTFIALNGLTDVNGELSVARVYSANQPVTGWTRKSSSSPYYAQGLIVGTISSSTGFDGAAVMILDE